MLISNTVVQGSQRQSVPLEVNPPIVSNKDPLLRTAKNEKSSARHSETLELENLDAIFESALAQIEAEIKRFKRVAFMDQKRYRQTSGYAKPPKNDEAATAGQTRPANILGETPGGSDEDVASLLKLGRAQLFTPDQLGILKHQIYAFKLLSKNKGIPAATQRYLFGQYAN
jgi:hypothetical protein